MALNVLEQVASAAGKNEKLQILKDNKDNKELAELLNATFDPYRRFHVKKWDMPEPIGGKPTGVDNIHERFMSLLSDLENRAITGNTAKAFVESFFLICQSEFQQNWYAKVLRKDLKAGFSAKTAVKAGFTDIPLFDVMLAKDGKTCKKIDEIISKGVYVSPKFDGYRCLAVIDNGEVTLYSRNGTVYSNFPNIQEQLSKAFHFGSFVFDGEIMSDDFQSMQKSAFANKRGTTVGDVKYHIFGYVPYDEWVLQKFKMTTSLRLKTLNTLSQHFSDDLVKVEHTLINDKQQILDMEREYISQGFEGAMTLPDIPYYLGKKTNKLMKFKTMLSQDCIITGFYKGKVGTRLQGMMGGIMVTQENGNSCECGTGFSDEDRQYMWDNQDEFVGQTVEIKYQELTNDNIMRFPVFMRFRNDKT